MSVTRDTSHSSIGPCGPLEPSPCVDSLRYASTALLSSALDRGENTGVVAHKGLLKLCIPHGPLQVQECGEMLASTISNGIRRCGGKRICACRCTVSICLCVCVRAWNVWIVEGYYYYCWYIMLYKYKKPPWSVYDRFHWLIDGQNKFQLNTMFSR